MMIILGEGNHISLGRDLESATARDFDAGTLELADVVALVVEHGDVELIAVRVSDQDVSRVGDVDPVRKTGDSLVTDPTAKLTILANDNDTVA